MRSAALALLAAVLAGCASSSTMCVATDCGPPDAGADADAGPCPATLACGPCTSRAECGFCGATGACMEGAGTAPPGCASGWAWVATDCPGAGTECPTLHDCDTCVGDPNCGFCETSGTCMASDGTMPTMGGTCPDPGFVTFSCPATPAQCAMHADCASCAADDCGWCGATSACLPANTDGSGPAMGTCAHGWAWIYTDCPGYDGGTFDAGTFDGGTSDAGPADAAHD